jgi:hypothetical protein
MAITVVIFISLRVVIVALVRPHYMSLITQLVSVGQGQGAQLGGARWLIDSLEWRAGFLRVHHLPTRHQVLGLSRHRDGYLPRPCGGSDRLDLPDGSKRDA